MMLPFLPDVALATASHPWQSRCASCPGPSCQRPGPSCQRPGPSCQLPGPSCQRPGPSCQRSGPSCQRPGPSCQRPGPSCQRPGPNCQRPGPSCQRPGPNCRTRAQLPATRAQAAGIWSGMSVPQTQAGPEAPSGTLVVRIHFRHISCLSPPCSTLVAPLAVPSLSLLTETHSLLSPPSLSLVASLSVNCKPRISRSK